MMPFNLGLWFIPLAPYCGSLSHDQLCCCSDGHNQTALDHDLLDLIGGGNIAVEEEICEVQCQDCRKEGR